MNVVKLTGGLGNQMFQYVFGQHLSKKFGIEIIYDISSFENQPDFLDHRKLELTCFNFPTPIVDHKAFSDFKALNKSQKFISTIKSFLKFSNDDFFSINESMIKISWLLPKRIKNKYYLGYWHHIKYLHSAEIDLVKTFALKPEFHKQLTNGHHKQDISNSSSVSIQVRRGDYLNVGTVICGPEYYSNAIEYINKKISNPKYFVFSDDIEWCKKNLNFNAEVIFIEPNLSLPFEDMQLMSMCKHNIIVNSTYGWWGTILNEHRKKITIAPKLWINPLNLKTFIKL